MNIRSLFTNRSFFKTLKFKVILLITVCSFLVIGSIVVHSTLSSRLKMIEVTQNSIDAISTQFAKETENVLEKPMFVARTLVSTFENFQQVPREKRRLVYNSFIRSTLLQNTDYLSVWVIFEPNAIDNLDSLYKDELKNITGQYISTYFRTSEGIMEESPTEQSEMEIDFENYYAIPKRTLQETVLDPYLYSYTGSRKDNVLETSMVVPILVDAKFLGVVGIDINLSYYQKILNQYRPLGTGVCFLVSNNGTLVTFPDKKLIGKNFKEFNAMLERKYEIIGNLNNNKPRKFIDKLFNDKLDYYITINPIKIGDFPDNWAFITAVPAKAMEESANKSFFLSARIGLIGIIVMIIMIWIAAQRVAKPLHEVSNVLEQIAIGNIKDNEFKNVNRFSGEEMKRIATMVNELINNLKKTAEFIHQVGIGNLHAEYNILSDGDIIGHSLMEMRKNLMEAEILEKKRKDSEVKQNWVTEGIAKFSEILRQNIDSIEELSYEITSNLVNYLQANQGGLFLYSDEDKSDIHLHQLASFAYSRRRYITKKIEIGQGLIGACALEKRTIYLTKIPDNYIEITSGLGTAPPNSVLIVPLVINNNIFGVIEIASFTVYEDYVILFVEKIAESIASTLLSAKINAQTQTLLKQFKEQSNDMAKNERLLTKNMEEMQLAQYEARNREIEMKNIFDALSSSFLTAEFDMNGNILQINDEYLTILKITRKQAIGKNLLELMPLESKEIDLNNKRWTALKQGTIQKFEQFIPSEENGIWLSQTFTPIFNEKNIPYKVLNIASDISIVKQHDQEIKLLLLESQEKAEQMAVQETEIIQTFQELELAQKEINDKSVEYSALKREYDELKRYSNSLQKQYEKHFETSSEFETSLKSKITELEEQLDQIRKSGLSL